MPSSQRMTTENYLNQSNHSKYEEPLSGSINKKSRKASDLHGQLFNNQEDLMHPNTFKTEKSAIT